MSRTDSIVKINLLKENRFAKIRISDLFLIENHELVLRAFFELKLIPIRCENRFDCLAFEYIVMSPQLPQIPLGNIPPFYEIIITAEEAGDTGINYKFELKEQNDSDTWFKSLCGVIYPAKELPNV